MILGAGITTATQLTATAARLVAFAYIVLELAKVGTSSSVLVAIGYIPFLAFLDIGIQGYARAKYLQGGLPFRGPAFRRSYAGAALCLMSIGAALNGSASDSAFQLLLISAYVLASGAQLWERWLASGPRPLICAAVEVGLLSVSVLAFVEWGAIDAVLLAGLASMPLARLATHAFSGAIGPEDVPSPQRRTDWRTYVGFSLAQQFAGAAAAALPSMYAQLCGDYSTLARNLVVFRLVHSGAALASTVINSIASRVFFGTAGAAFASAERMYVERAGAIGAVGVFVGLTTVVASQLAVGESLPVATGVALFLILVNLQSSLLMNRGMPRRAFYCQLLVLAVSVCMLGALEGHDDFFAALMLVVIFGFFLLHHSNIRVYKEWLRLTVR